MQLAITSLMEILKQQSSKHIRMFFLISALQNLKNEESIVQSLMTAAGIISELPENEY